VTAAPRSSPAGYFSGVAIGCDRIAYTEFERRALAERDDAFAHTVLRAGMTLARRTPQL
jgi:hypothetical protein